MPLTKTSWLVQMNYFRRQISLRIRSRLAIQDYWIKISQKAVCRPWNLQKGKFHRSLDRARKVPSKAQNQGSSAATSPSQYTKSTSRQNLVPTHASSHLTMVYQVATSVLQDWSCHKSTITTTCLSRWRTPWPPQSLVWLKHMKAKVPQPWRTTEQVCPASMRRNNRKRRGILKRVQVQLLNCRGWCDEWLRLLIEERMLFECCF